MIRRMVTTMNMKKQLVVIRKITVQQRQKSVSGNRSSIQILKKPPYFPICYDVYNTNILTVN